MNLSWLTRNKRETRIVSLIALTDTFNKLSCVYDVGIDYRREGELTFLIELAVGCGESCELEKSNRYQ